MANWETLRDGEAQNPALTGNGYTAWLWDTDDNKNILAVGDVVKVTMDGIAYPYTVRNTRNTGDFVGAGNAWLGSSSASTTIEDDGTDIYFWEYNGSIRFITRTYGPHYVKFERAVPVPVLNPSVLMQGFFVGQALRRNRT